MIIIYFTWKSKHYYTHKNIPSVIKSWSYLFWSWRSKSLNHVILLLKKKQYTRLINQQHYYHLYNFILTRFFLTGRSYQGINEEIIWVSIGMGIAIAVLITVALCYIMREKCIQRREYFITAWTIVPVWTHWPSSNSFFI